ncbi:family 90 glycosyltransferase [Melampsora larici-populina 98AG31]|uniref:Family 90 glycosyltransferase n=1 Tax=Melampsora larici-populina (strain 98AG31 / pathotype 3-4-7) TaxID=747676 RepID=F4R6Q8_MELLP|nr:family 90 glycosyltransferase [Melampsora larici-populina 98AG31]EGG12417.1 family 90 glycosyltransferase [Melampsora larici-populina 98AG31]
MLDLEATKHSSGNHRVRGRWPRKIPLLNIVSWFSIATLSVFCIYFFQEQLRLLNPSLHSYVSWNLFQHEKSTNPLAQYNLSPPTPEQIFSPIRYPISDKYPEDTATGLTYHPNGHLLLQSASIKLQKHPFMTLIERAKLEWKSKLARQSKTLKEAVTEYKRRNGRNPPAGFELWYAYATKNNVNMIDEYDQISRDLFPLWALSPNELRKRADTIQTREKSPFILHFDPDGNLAITGESAATGNANYLGGLCQEFAPLLASANLPPISMVLRSLDEPRLLLGWDQQKRLHELAKLGQYNKINGVELEEYDPAKSDINMAEDWAVHCPPESSIHRDVIHSSSPDTALRSSRDDQQSSVNHSWIFHHPRSMDICMNPDDIDKHGATAGRAWPPSPMVPLFALSKTPLHAEILVVPPLWDDRDEYENPIPWSERPYDKLYWRGTWNTTHRIRLHQFTHQSKSNTRVLTEDEEFTNLTKANQNHLSIHEFESSTSKLNQRYMNISLVGGPYQCDPKQCEKLKKMIEFGKSVSIEEGAKHKYVLDVDGNGWSGRFRRLLATQHLVLKSSILPEWYSDRIQPWYHYIPSNIDYTDLYDIMSFFTGDMEGNGAHEDLAEIISSQGRHWALNYFRWEDMVAYMFRLVLEYTRLYHRSEKGTSTDFDESLLL